MTILKRLVPGCALVALAVGAADAATVPPGGRLDFDVIRDGSKIGTHKLAFANAGSDLKVDIATDIEVKVMFVTAYSFTHRGEETWRNGQLVALTSTTNDDGEKHHLNVHQSASGLTVNGDGYQGNAPARIIPASLWAYELVQQQSLLNTLDGKLMDVRVSDMGQDTLRVGGEDMPAHHYSLSGDLARELWYDRKGTLVKVSFKADDGSNITYLRK